MADAPPLSLSTTLPIGLKLLFLGTLCAAVLGLAWVVVVWCVVCLPQRRDGDGDQEAQLHHKETWQSDQGRQWSDKEVKPSSKVQRNRSNHTQRSLGEADEGMKDMREMGDVANPFADHANMNEDEDTSAALSSGVQRPGTSRFRGRKDGAVGSLWNPFLDPPGEGEGSGSGSGGRTDEEWERARAVFFGEVEDARGEIEVEMRDLSCGQVNDVEATALKKGDRRSGFAAVVRRGIEMLDEGVGMVDGVVDDAVAAVARWTDDER